jgi:hypothetical protein
MTAITTLLRFLLMSATAEISLCLFGAGFDHRGWILVAGFVVIIASIPVALFTAAMMLIEVTIGRKGAVYISLLGLLPTIVILFLSFLFGSGREGWRYASAVILGGLIWGAMWLLTSKLQPQTSADQSDLEYE